MPRGSVASVAVGRSRQVNDLPITHGWVIPAAGVVGYICSSPGQTYSVSIFIEHFIRDLGITRSTVSTLYMVGTLCAGLTMPFVGRQIDRRGPRVIVGVVTVFFALALLYMSLVRNAWMLGFGFLLIRMLGQGSMSIVSGNVLNQWWVQRRGLIFGMAGILFSLLGSGSFPTLINTLIGRFGWRTSYRSWAWLLRSSCCRLASFSSNVDRRTTGCCPMGRGSSPARAVDGVQTAGAGASPVEENWTSREAVRTGAFWIIGLGLGSISMLSTGLQFHMVSIFADAGWRPRSLPGPSVGGADWGTGSRGQRRAGGSHPGAVPAFAALVGQTASLLLAPRLSASSAGMYGIARDVFGSYAQGLTLLAVLPFVLGIVALFSRRPLRKAVVRV